MRRGTGAGGQYGPRIVEARQNETRCPRKDGSEVKARSERSTRDELHWILPILWGGLPQVASERPSDNAEPYLIFPSALRSHLLVPLLSRRAASRSIRQYTDATPVKQRVARGLLGAGLRLGLTQLLLRDRCEVPAPEGQSILPLKAYLRSILDRPDLQFGISLGAVRANRKPVLQLMTGDGRPLGYAKIGWNVVTRDLVRREASVLSMLAARAEKTEHLQIPGVLFSGRWRGLELLIVSPAHSRQRWSLISRLQPPTAATRELGRFRGQRRTTLRGTRYWQEVTKRAFQLRRGGSTRVVSSIEEAVGSLEAIHGDTSLSFGMLHGDWVPWNMRSGGGLVTVWDWERSMPEAPLGLDPIHFDFQVRLWIRGDEPDAALAANLAEVARLIGMSGPAVQPAGLLVAFNILEMALRLEEGASQGVPVPPRIYRAVPELLSHAVMSAS
jgi:hypothetical protein